MFKYSKYNYVYTLSEGDFLVVNSLYGTKCKIRTNITPDKWELNLYKLESPTLSLLLENKLVVPIDLDEDLLNQYNCHKKIYSEDTLRMQIVLGHQCNFNCSYCWQNHTNDYDLSSDAQIKLPRFLSAQLRKRKGLSVDWIGGEPLLYSKVINELSEQCILIAEKHHCKYSAAMTTNGFLLDDTMQKIMIHRNKIHCFMITLDGTEETHNLLRTQKGGKDSFRIIMENICNLLVHKPSYVSIIIRINVSPELIGQEEKIAETFRKLPNMRNLIYMAIPTVDFKKDEVKISFDDYIDFCIKMRKYGISIQPVYKTKFMAGVCSSAYDSFFSYTENGSIKKCVQGDVELPINEFYNSQKINAETSKWMEPQKLIECLECKLLPMCQGLVCPARKEYCHLKMVMDPRYGQLLDEENIATIQI